MRLLKQLSKKWWQINNIVSEFSKGVGDGAKKSVTNECMSEWMNEWIGFHFDHSLNLMACQFDEMALFGQ